MNELIARYRSAAYCLKLLEETGASTEAVLAQRDVCRELRALINEGCPDGSLSPHEFNIVEKPV